MAKLYNPNLPGVVYEAPDDADHLAVQAEGGWVPVPAEAYPEDTPRGVEPDPVVFVPVNARTGKPVDDMEAIKVNLGPRPEQQPDQQPVASGYEDQTVEELRAELERRGLPKSGNKAELVERLSAPPEPEPVEPAVPAEPQPDDQPD